ncbi:PRC-barrel domain-containing protein [Glycocaulis sp.]|uniref:PRC-barrel domain-containing protein n=1 Tax=Glycocaulis sp. TaxID=1969725 RepID=UPI003D1E37E1
MKTMLIASSALALVAAPSVAQDPVQDPATQQQTTGDRQHTTGERQNDWFNPGDWFDDGHSLEGVAVYSRDGERIGTVDRVAGGIQTGQYTDMADGRTEDLDVDGLVVSTGGFLGIGTREVRVEAGNATRTSVNGEQRIILDMSNEEFERMREHAREDDGMWNGQRTQQDRTQQQHLQPGRADQDRTGQDRDWQDRDTQQPGQDRDWQDQQRQDRDQWTDDDEGGLIPASNTQTGVQGQAGHDRGTFATDDAFRDDHPLRDVAVYTNDGERVGSVERVRGGADAGTYTDMTDGDTSDLDVTGLVVETGGFLGIGTREVEIEAGSAQRTSVDGEQRIILDMSNAEFERLREHARDDDDGMWNTDDRTDRTDRTWQDRQDGAATQTDAGLQGQTQTQAQTQTQPGAAGQTQADAATQRAQASGEVHGDVYTDGHHWVDTPVFSSDGERLGSVHQVRSYSDTAYARGGDTVAMTEPDPDVAAVIVRTNGFLGLGRRQVEVDIDQVELEMQDGEPRLVLGMTQSRFEDLPDHERNRNRAGG